MSDSARYADIVLPGSLQEEDEGTVTQTEGRVIKINKAVECPGEARPDWQIIQDIAKALGREHGPDLRESARDLRRAAPRVQGWDRRLLRDYLRTHREELRRVLAVSERGAGGRADARPQGTPRLFEPGSWNPVAKGAGPFYFPDGKARLNVTPHVGPAEDVDEEFPIILTTRSRRQPVPLGESDQAHRSARRSVSGAADRNAPATGDATGHCRR